MSNKKKIKTVDCNSYKVRVLKCSTRPSLLQTSFKLPSTPQGAAELLTSSCMNMQSILNITYDWEKQFFSENNWDLKCFLNIQNFLQKTFSLKMAILHKL